MSDSLHVLGFGDNTVDRNLELGLDYPGGNSVNVAVFARRLGATSEYLGVFGDDAAGTFLRDAIEAQGVSTRDCVVRRGETSVSHLHVRDGERLFLDWNEGGVATREPLVLDGDLLERVQRFDLVHAGVYGAVEPELRKLTEPLVSYDLSDEPEFRTPDHLDRVCPYADLVLLSCGHLSEAETVAVLGEAVHRGATLALGTRGLEGAVVTDGHLVRSAPARRADRPLVDTMGCGDAFLAGFAMALLRAGWSKHVRPTEADLVRALDAGAAAALDQCFVEGAFGHGRATLR
jgi:sugar/nucleoside kinase (ribokinase family)